MKTTNLWTAVRRLALIATVMATCWACSSDTRTASERIAEARASNENKRYRDTIIEMRNLLRRDGNNVDARLLLGEALLATGDVETAEKEASRARDLGAPPDLYIETLARAMQGSNNHVELIAEIDPDSVTNPELASTLRALRGRSMMELGSVDKAMTIFDTELEGGSVEARRLALLGKAAHARTQQDFEQAEKLIEQAIELVPNSPESILALGRVYLTQEKFEYAEALLARARNEIPRASRKDWFFVEAQYAEALLGLGKLNEARESTTVLKNIGQKHPMSAFLLGRVEFESGNTDKAIEMFQQVLAEYPAYAPAQTLMGIIMIQREDFDQAEMHLANAVSNSPQNVRARRLLAETRLRMGRDKAAVRTLNDGLGIDSTDAELLTMLGRAKVRSGDQDAGLQHLQKAYAESPDSVQAGLALASAYLSNGDSDAAIRTIKSLPEKSISAQRRQILIRVAQLDNSNRQKAEAQIEQLVNDAPDDIYVMGLAGSFYAATDQTSKARTLFNKILAVSPGSRAAMLNILNLDERINDYSESQSLFEAAHRHDPRDLLPALVLARIYEATGKPDQAIGMVTTAYEHNPAALLPNLMLAAHALRNGRYEEAERYATVAVVEYPNSARAHALRGFAEMHLGKTSASKNDFQRAVVLSPDTIQYRYFLGRAAWANGQVLLARTSFENVLRTDADHLPATHALAVLLANMGKRAQAEKLLKKLTTTVDQDRRVLVAIGETLAALDRTAEAISAFEQAQDMKPTWAAALALFNLRAEAAIDDPTRSLRRWSDIASEDHRPRLKIAQFHHSTGDVESAIVEYEKTLQLDTGSVIALNNLAWLYFERGIDDDRDNALVLAKRAFELSNGSPPIADTYGWLLYRTGDVKNSRAILREAFQQTTAIDDPDIAYHYAVVLDNHGMTSSARTILEDALSSEKQFASRADAQLLYASYLENARN